MKGIIVYDRLVAEDREWYIGHHIECASRHGMELSLVYTDEVLAGELLPAEGTSALPEFAIMRDINPEAQKMLEDMGVTVFNSSKVSDICNDKLAAYDHIEKLFGEKIFLPVFSFDEYDGQYPMVLKSRSGCGGTQVFWADSREQAIRIIEESGLGSEQFIVQVPCNNPGIDIRTYVIGDRAVVAMKRENALLGEEDGHDVSEYFRSNFELGGRAARYDIESDTLLYDMVMKIAKDLKPGLIGIDFIFHNGRPVFNEIEDVVGSRMVYANTDVDIVEEYTSYIHSVMS